MTFLVEWYDKGSDLIKTYLMIYYGLDGTCEIVSNSCPVTCLSLASIRYNSKNSILTLDCLDTERLDKQPEISSPLETRQCNPSSAFLRKRHQHLRSTVYTHWVCRQLYSELCNPSNWKVIQLFLGKKIVFRINICKITQVKYLT